MNEANKQQLLSLLRENRAVLMVGAGSSKLIGYPLLAELVEEMRLKLAQSLPARSDEEPSVYADFIKDHLAKLGRLHDYYNFLERRFEPRTATKNHDDFHVALVKLPFCGIVTTNYDLVLETAVIEAFSNENGPFLCEPLDLCRPRPYLPFDFLRGLSSQRLHKFVLHIHGCCRNPPDIILTRRDYSTKYGNVPTFDKNGTPLSRDLDSLHRRVLWSLLAMHSLVFVGFTLEDEYFTHMLRVVQADFELGSDAAHFAVLPFTSDTEKERTKNMMTRGGITPVFYHVAPRGTQNKDHDHSALKRLILELADSLGVSVGSPNVSEVTKRMLER